MHRIQTSGGGYLCVKRLCQVHHHCCAHAVISDQPHHFYTSLQNVAHLGEVLSESEGQIC